LNLHNCYWENIELINVAISTLRKLIIYFDVICVEYDHNMTVKIDAVNLLSLSCTCLAAIEFIPVNLTSIVDAYVDLQGQYPFGHELYVAHCIFELLSGLSSVKSLNITNETLEVCLSICSSSSFLYILHWLMPIVNVAFSYRCVHSRYHNTECCFVSFTSVFFTIQRVTSIPFPHFTI
jgi:hypothetical protein